MSIQPSDEVMKWIESYFTINSNSDIDSITKAINESLQPIKDDISLSDEKQKVG